MKKIVETYSKELLELLATACRDKDIQYDIVPSKVKKSKFQFLVEDKNVYKVHRIFKRAMKERNYRLEDIKLEKFLDKERKKAKLNDKPNALIRFLMLFRNK